MTDDNQPRPAMVLRWQRELADRLEAVSPPNHTRILAVAGSMVSHANSDGSRMEAGIRRLASKTGQHLGRVSEAIDWLEGDGWLRFEKRIAHGGRRYTLTIPVQSSATGNAASDADTGTLDGQRPVSVRSASGQRSGEGNEPPYLRTSVPPEEARAAGGEAEHEPEYVEWCRRRCAERGGGPGLFHKMLREDRDLFEAEMREEAEVRKIFAELEASRLACTACDDQGHLLDANGQPIDPAEPCQHPEAARAS